MMRELCDIMLWFQTTEQCGTISRANIPHRYSTMLSKATNEKKTYIMLHMRISWHCYIRPYGIAAVALSVHSSESHKTHTFSITPPPHTTDDGPGRSAAAAAASITASLHATTRHSIHLCGGFSSADITLHCTHRTHTSITTTIKPSLFHMPLVRVSSEICRSWAPRAKSRTRRRRECDRARASAVAVYSCANLRACIVHLRTPKCHTMRHADGAKAPHALNRHHHNGHLSGTCVSCLRRRRWLSFVRGCNAVQPYTARCNCTKPLLPPTP